MGFALLKKYHWFLVRRAEAGNPLTRQIEISVQSTPWCILALVGVGLCALLDAKVHLTVDQRGLVILPFFAISFIGIIYVIGVITTVGMRKDVRKGNSRGPWDR